MERRVPPENHAGGQKFLLKSTAASTIMNSVHIYLVAGASIFALPRRFAFWQLDVQRDLAPRARQRRPPRRAGGPAPALGTMLQLRMDTCLKDGLIGRDVILASSRMCRNFAQAPPLAVIFGGNPPYIRLAIYGPHFSTATQNAWQCMNRGWGPRLSRSQLRRSHETKVYGRSQW